MPATMTKGRVPMEMKKLSISAKRQITIPQKFFTMLGFDTEAECTVRGNELVIRPARANTGGEFAEQILADLIANVGSFFSSISSAAASWKSAYCVPDSSA